MLITIPICKTCVLYQNKPKNYNLFYVFGPFITGKSETLNKTKVDVCILEYRQFSLNKVILK